MQTSKRWFLLFGLLLVLLACTIDIGGPTPPAPPPTIDPAALEQLKTNWATALANAAATNGKVTVTITEVQVAALLASKLAKDPDAFFQQPQVVLQNNQIQIFGVAKQSKLVANIQMTITVSVNEEGVPEFHLVSADFGPLPVPTDLLEGVSDMLNEALTGKIVPSATGFRLESITIADGAMTIQGTVH